MKVNYWSDRKKIADMSISELIAYEVSSTDSERGRLEDVECQLRKLMEIVGKIAETLPEDKQQRLANEFFYWRRYEDFM